MLISSLWCPVTGCGEWLKAVSGKDISKKTFTRRMIEHWNKLSREVVMTPSLSMSKKCLDNALQYMV